jgi:beta-lactamase class D
MNRSGHLWFQGLIAVFAFLLPPMAQAGVDAAYEDLFKGYRGCFLLVEAATKKTVIEYNPGNRCHERIPPDSTFKIPLSLMAFDSGTVTESTLFKWDGKVTDSFAGWNQDQTPESWLKYSVVWVSQRIAPQLGPAVIEKYLSDFGYGNRDFSGDPGKHNGLTNAWLSSSLKISAVEQVEFLRRLETRELHLREPSIGVTKRLIHQGTLKDGSNYYAKTGSGWREYGKPGTAGHRLRDGWFVGIVEKGPARYIFAANVTEREPNPKSDRFGGQVAREIALSLLNDYFAR